MRPFRQLVFAAGLQFFQAILANRFQHHESRFAFCLHLVSKALVHNRRHAVQQIKIEITFCVAHCLRTFERATAHEYCQSPKKLLLARAQQVITPINRRAQSLLPLRQVSRTAGQQL